MSVWWVPTNLHQSEEAFKRYSLHTHHTFAKQLIMLYRDSLEVMFEPLFVSFS